jgi:hypothetical protein
MFGTNAGEKATPVRKAIEALLSKRAVRVVVN